MMVIEKLVNKFKIKISLLFIPIALLMSCSHTPKNISMDQTHRNFEKVEKKVINVGKGESTPVHIRVYDEKVLKNKEDLKVLCNSKGMDFDVDEVNINFFVSINYFEKKKKVSCFVEIDKVKYQILSINVLEKKYPFEKLNVDKSKVVYSKKDLKRIRKERKILNKLYGFNLKDVDYEINVGRDLIFSKPLTSKITSYYGTRRLYNNLKQSYHFGVDFRARVGKKIPVAADGKVVFVGDLFFTGNTVIVYHGQGVFTVYAHLSKVLVKKNEFVPIRSLIGLAGMTGRVTGPHLHWGVKVQGNWVDGMSLVSLSRP